MCVCVCVRVRACVRACVHACASLTSPAVITRVAASIHRARSMVASSGGGPSTDSQWVSTVFSAPGIITQNELKNQKKQATRKKRNSKLPKLAAKFEQIFFAHKIHCGAFVLHVFFRHRSRKCRGSCCFVTESEFTDRSTELFKVCVIIPFGRLTPMIWMGCPAPFTPSLCSHLFSRPSPGLRGILPTDSRAGK